MVNRLRRKTSKPSVLAWLRGSGIASILLGCFGLMQTFFWPSVILVFAGLTVLFIDLWFERFNKWIRWMLMFFIFCVAFSFNYGVVLHKGPLDLSVSHEGESKRVTLIVRNNTDDDYRSFDATIRTEPKDCLIESIDQQPGLCHVAFENSTTLRRKDDMGRFEYHAKEKAWTPKMNFARMSCDNFVRGSEIVLYIWLTCSPQALQVEGAYAGKFRTLSYNKLLPVTRP
jgi:hypothetical protein